MKFVLVILFASMGDIYYFTDLKRQISETD